MRLVRACHRPREGEDGGPGWARGGRAHLFRGKQQHAESRSSRRRFRTSAGIVREPVRRGRDQDLGFAHVLDDARVGRDRNVCDGAYIEGGAVVGDRVTVKNQVMIFAGVTVEDEVFLGPESPSPTTSPPGPPDMAGDDAEHRLAVRLRRGGASVGAVGQHRGSRAHTALRCLPSSAVGYRSTCRCPLCCLRVSSSWFLVVCKPLDIPSGQSSDVQLRYLDGRAHWFTTTLAEVDGWRLCRR